MTILFVPRTLLVSMLVSKGLASIKVEASRLLAVLKAMAAKYNAIVVVACGCGEL
jgi:hypothetical protein